MANEKPVNRRKHDRYFIEDIPIDGIGQIVEVSRKGLKIRKIPEFTATGQTLNFKLSTLEIKTEVRWEDKDFTGLLFAGAFNDPKFIVKRIKRPTESAIPPQMKVPDEAIQQYKKDEILNKIVNLLMEIDTPDPNMRKIGIYVDEISDLEEKKKQAEEAGRTEEEAAKETGKNEQSLKDELIARAVSSNAGNESGIKDINFAINRLGSDNVRVILRNYVHKRIFQSENAFSIFEGCEVCDILKSAVFKKLCSLFGFSDIQPEGNALLSCETVGVEILIRESSSILDNYYKSPSRLYSEISRMYEKSLFGIDPIQINKHYFKNVLGAFEDLDSGYVIAHSTLNLHYSPPDDIKISLTKNGLIFSYIAYLTFLAVKFIIDRDKESGTILSKRLRGRGMDDKKIIDFLDKAVNETKTILKDFGIKGSVTRPQLPADPVTLESYLATNKRFEYLLQAFRDFKSMNSGRMALRYDDDSYAHFILGRIINSENFDLNSKSFIVVPCNNLSDDYWYIRDFANFDLLVFKDIHKLTEFHMNTFIKLWNSFEGQIIATFSNLGFLDFTRPQLYSILNAHIADFPSYFVGNDNFVYRKMVEYAVNGLKPYIAGQIVEIDRYFKNVIYSMKCVKTDILLNKDIV